MGSMDEFSEHQNADVVSHGGCKVIYSESRPARAEISAPPVSNLRRGMAKAFNVVAPVVFYGALAYGVLTAGYSVAQEVLSEPAAPKAPAPIR